MLVDAFRAPMPGEKEGGKPRNAISSIWVIPMVYGHVNQASEC